MAEPTNEERKSVGAAIGCLGFTCALPALAIWLVLLGLLINKTGGGAMEWSLFVGYCVLAVIGNVVMHFARTILETAK